MSILLHYLFVNENEAGRSQYLTYFRNPVFIVGFFFDEFQYDGHKETQNHPWQRDSTSACGEPTTDASTS